MMQLEFHQLDRRYEFLRVRNPQRQQQLLVSLAATGQQTPIIVVAVADQPNRYLVIDGYQRIAALEQLGRDTVEAVVWPLSEAEALVLDRSLRWSKRDSALEEGWLLAELEQRFNYSVEELARRFDRSVRWVADRLALVELLPESVQQQVRRGAISAHVAMKFLVPVARSRPEDCQRLAEAFAAHHSTSREAGQLYAAWRDASASVRERVLEDPELFLKVQRQHSPDPSAPLITQLLRDLEMVVAIIRRENRRLVGATVALDPLECAQIHGRIAQAQQELHRLATKIPKIPQEEEHVESKPTDHDSGIACPRGEQTRDCSGAEHQPAIGTQSAARELSGGTETLASGEGRTLSPADSGTARQLQGESGAGAGGAGGQRSASVVLDPDRLLPPAWHRTTAHRAVWKLPFPARGIIVSLRLCLMRSIP